jgi:hypothetical protein
MRAWGSGVYGSVGGTEAYLAPVIPPELERIRAPCVSGICCPSKVRNPRWEFDKSPAYRRLSNEAPSPQEFLIHCTLLLPSSRRQFSCPEIAILGFYDDSTCSQ